MGTTFKIYLPVATETPDERTTLGAKQSAQKGIETILLVEDNDQVRQLGRTILERQGYNLLEANSGEEALAILTSHGAAVHLLLTDVVMPGINGKELYQRAIQSSPHLKVLYTYPAIRMTSLHSAACSKKAFNSSRNRFPLTA